jgi:hypothetical protein
MGAGWGLQVAGYRLQVAGYRLQVGARKWTLLFYSTIAIMNGWAGAEAL